MTLRTGESGPLHAARTFIVPMTLFSCARRAVVTIGSTTRRVSTTVSISAASTMRRISEWESATWTNSVRSSSTFGGRRSTPMTVSTSGLRSSAWATRPPQWVESPVTRTRLEVFEPWVTSAEPHALSVAEHVEELVLDRRADVVGDGLHQALVLPRLLAHLVGAHRRQEADLELGRQVAEHPEQPAVRERRGDREVDEPGQALQQRDVGEDRRGL